MSQRTLAQWLDYLGTLHPKAIDLGLERVAQVGERLGLGRPARRVVSVTGSNGKGSSCTLIAALLAAQGQRVGVYTSPHIVRYNERVSIAGEPASDQALCEAFAAVEAARGEVTLTYFEMGTLAALWLFARANLDAVVLEVGLGGRLDAVNWVDADLALITSISLEHTDWLGDTREAIAIEKAGIFRSGRPALCGDSDPPQALLDHCQQQGVPLWLRGRDFDWQSQDGGWRWRWRGRAKPAPGQAPQTGQRVQLDGLPWPQLPVENAALALQAAVLLDVPLERAMLSKVLANTRLAGRLERRSLNYQGRVLTLILDVAHNPESAAYLARHLPPLPAGGRRLAVFGLLADKDLQQVLAPMLAKVQDWAVANLDTPRSRPAAELYGALQACGAQASCHETIAQALQAQCAKATEDDQILVFGSFFTVAAVLSGLS